MEWTAIVMQLFTGLSLGMLYVLLALGLTIVFGLLTVVNFAHGAMYMWGAYAGVSILTITGNFWLALIAAPLVMGLYGLLVERTLIRPLYGRDINYPLLLTFGLQFIMIEIVRIFWGTSDMPVAAPESLSLPLNFFDIFFFPSYRLFVIGLTLVICLILWFFLEKTNLGLIIRAGTRDPLMVRALGIDMSRIWWLVFGIGSALAGIAGILAAPIRSVFPEMGLAMLVECFVVVVVGGMGSLKGAILAGIIMGEASSLTTLFYPQMADIVIFLVMAVVLLIRPSGLFGKAGLLE
ncbi:MAG: branched-chain amino acid ABC transporter permease [Deltaproteobacteria bacterium]|nr:branched-chain amino acid ABC transporter permease [Deltaproteobacteria bacterium]